MDGTEEGFYEDATDIQEQQTSTQEPPCAPSASLFPISSANPYSRFLQRSPLITHKIRHEWMLKLYEKHEHSVVYNNVRRDLVSGLADSAIMFDSAFEGGNLDLVVKVNHKEYEMYMRPDTNTLGHQQWFNFRVRVSRRKAVRFHVKNFNKGKLLYGEGLAPYAKSNRAKSDVWTQIDDAKSVKFEEDEEGHGSLTFDHEFWDAEEVQFCTQPPYTWERLKERITGMGLDSQLLCVSLLKIKIPKIQIGAKDIGKLEGVGLAIARQHPGESVGSWMMEGFMNHLVQNSPANFLWIIVPMVNIDGVVLGNNRTGIVGYDLNRLYNQDQGKASLKSEYVVEIKGILDLVKKLKKKYGRLLQMFLDFHGHSSRKNVFCYGPNYSQDSKEAYIEARLLPKIIETKTGLFKADECSYTIHPSKVTTARSVLFNKFKIPFCYTIQASYGLADNDTRLVCSDFLEVGKQIAISANEFMSFLSKKSKQTNNDFQHFQTLLQDIKKEIAMPSSSQNQFQQKSEVEDSSYDGSQDDLEGDMREDISLLLNKQKKKCCIVSEKKQKAVTLIQNNIQISSSYNHQHSQYVIDSKTLREAQKQITNKGQTFVSRFDLRREFRFRKITEMPSQSYLSEPYTDPDPSGKLSKDKLPKRYQQPEQSPTKNTLPPLKFPEPPIRKGSESNQRHDLSQRRIYTQTERGSGGYRQYSSTVKKMSAHLLTESYEQKSPVKRTILQREVMLREIARNKKNKVGRSLLIINEL